MAAIVQASAVSDPTSMSAGPTALLKLTYAGAQPTAGVTVVMTPLVGWAFDNQTPSLPVTPVAMSGLPPAPPATGPVVSPQWAVTYPGGNFVFAQGDAFVGIFRDFLTWLATNNGARRRLTVDITGPGLLDEWHDWARFNPDLVGS